MACRHLIETTARPLAPYPRHLTRPLRSRTLARRLKPEAQQELRCQQHDVMAGSTIHLDEGAPPEIFDPRQLQGEHSGRRSRNVPITLAGFVNGDRAL